VVIEAAQNLREEAGNALLKLLEEPPGHNILVLLALEPQMLLPTIVSRCCHVRFQPLDADWIETHLMADHGVAAERARQVSRIADGSLERALWLVEEERLKHWQTVMHNVASLGDLTMLDFFDLMGRWAKESKDLEQDFQCIKLWMREHILARLIEGHQPALQPDAKTWSAVHGVSIDALFQLYEHIEQAELLLRQNANKQLTLEGVCLALKDNLYGESGRNTVSQRR
jgi:DNA polymerase III subunit delta'